MIHIGIGRPASFGDKGVGSDGVGVKHSCCGSTLIFTGAVPGNCLAVLYGVNDTTVGIVSVVALVIAVVDDLHGDTHSNHVAGTIACSVAAAIATITSFRTGTAALGVNTCGLHQGSLIRFGGLCGFGGFLDRFFLCNCFFRDGFCALCGRFCCRFRFFCRRFCCFCGRFRYRLSCHRCIGVYIVCRSLRIFHLRSECSYCAQGETRNRQCEYQQKRHDFLHCVQFGFLLLGKIEKPLNVRKH